MNIDFSKINEIELCELVHHKIDNHYLEEALELLKQYVEVKPSYKTLTLLGYFYFRIGEPYEDIWRYRSDKAIMALEQALLWEPPYYYTYSILGEAYIQHHMLREAEEILKKALKFDSNTVVNNNIGVSLYMQGRIEDACNYFYSAHNLRKNEINYTYYPYLNYGICLSKLNRIKDSLDVAEKLMILEENDSSGEVDVIDIAKIFYFSKFYGRVVDTILGVIDYFSLSEDDFIVYGDSSLKTNNLDVITSALKDICEQNEEFIENISSNDDYSDEYKISSIIAKKNRIELYNNLYNNLLKGSVPKLSKEIYSEENIFSFVSLYKN